jgi:2-polyprenyl-6-methoxyphenol hydroxylase-like FAD-dependent oxidoreductase
LPASTTDRRVLISGAGIAGLTLAVLLKVRGYEPLVVERDADVRNEGYMMDFFGSGWDVAERMGLTDELRAIRYPIERLEFVDRDGVAYLTVPMDRMRKALAGRYVYLRRSDLERILYRRAVGAGVEFRFGTTVRSLTATDEAVEVQLSSGATDRFDLVFGADGVHSRIRALVFGEEAAFAYYLGGYVAAFHLPQTEELELHDSFRLHEELNRLVGFYPLGNGAVDATFVFRHPDIGHVPPEGRLPLLMQKWAGGGWMGKKILAEIPKSQHVYFDSLTQIRMPSWHRGRVALLGDAYVLATELERQADRAAAFAAYEALMETAVMKRQIEAERFVRIAMPTEKSWPWLRRLGTRLLFSGPGLKFGLGAFGAKSVLSGYA